MSRATSLSSRSRSVDGGQLDDVIVVEWTCNYGDGRLYRNVTIGELNDGEVVRVTDYWSEPTVTPRMASGE